MEANRLYKAILRKQIAPDHIHGSRN